MRRRTYPKGHDQTNRCTHAAGLGAPLFCAAWMAVMLPATTACTEGPQVRTTARGAPTAARPRASQALEARFQSLSGKTVALSHFRGKPLVVLFFTTWCVPCQVVATHLQRIRAALGNDRIAVLGVSIDTERRLVPTFVEAAGFNFPVVYGSPTLVRHGPLGAIRGVPRLLVLDPRGRLVADEQRPPTPRHLMQILRPLVRR